MVVMMMTLKVMRCRCIIIQNFSICFTNVLTLFIINLCDAFQDDESDATLKNFGSAKSISHPFQLTKSVRWKFEWTRWNMNLPNIVAIVGKIRPPQIKRVNDAGFEFKLRSVGTRRRHEAFSKRTNERIVGEKTTSKVRYHWGKDNGLKVISTHVDARISTPPLPIGSFVRELKQQGSSANRSEEIMDQLFPSLLSLPCDRESIVNRWCVKDNRNTCWTIYLHDCHGTVSHCSPIDRANENSTRQKRTRTIQNSFDQIKSMNKRS